MHDIDITWIFFKKIKNKNAFCEQSEKMKLLMWVNIKSTEN